MKIQMRVGIVAASLMLGLMAMLLVWQKIPAIQAQQSSPPHGQTATKLPDGRWLLLGGAGAEGTAAIVDPRVDRSTPLTAGWLPRSGHTATLLATGQVLIVGGRTPSGQLVSSADLFDPETGTIVQIAAEGGTPRSGHTTTLLTDGRVLVTGGTTDAQTSAADLEIWDVQINGVTTITAAVSGLDNARSAHTATLLADGRVLLSGGVDAAGAGVTQEEVFDPASGRITVEPAADADPMPPYLAASLPFTGAQSVPVDVRLALRLSKPLLTETVNRETVSLAGPDGPVEIAIVSAEGGRLVFVSPRAALSHDTAYTLTIAGAIDPGGLLLAATSLTFVTAEKTVDDANAADVTDGEAWIPDAQSAANGWRSQRPDSPWQKLPPLEAPPGVTALSGQVLRLDGRPLQDVTLEVQGRTTQTNGTGRFLLLLEGLPSGEQELVIDGRTANRPGRTYGLFETRVKITAGATTALPFTSWSPQLDTANQVTIPSPTTAETVVTTPLIPGLELHMSAGTVIHDHRDGSYARTISITPIPVDRPPFPMPVDAEFPVFFTIQPGGTYIHSYGAGSRGTWLVYPNVRGAREGKRVQFFNYDPTGPGWYVYGMGTVKGNQVVPDAKTRLYRFTGASFNDGQAPPPAAPTPGDDCGKCADPVSLTTGIFTFDATDLYIADVLPIAVTRSYNSRDVEVRPFGRGMSHAYAIFQHTENMLEEADLYLPDGGKIHYVRMPESGSQWYNAVLEHTATPTAFYRSRVQYHADDGKFYLTLKDGTVYIFGHGAPLQAIRDRHGNEIRISWSIPDNGFGAGTGNITRITSPNGRWIEFTYYSGTKRVHQAKDNIGRTVTYAYDANGNLTSVTDPMNYVTSYTYDASNRMTAIKPPDLQATQVNAVTNEYTTAADAPTPVGWVKKQTHADGGTFQFSYTVTNGKSTQTDVTDPRGFVRRVTFNANGYTVEDKRALGEPEEHNITSERQPNTNFVTSSMDSLKRQTTRIYDDIGNLRSVTRLAGTSNAVTTSYTYEPTFNQVETITDPLLHTTTFAYDSVGNLSTVTDPLNHATTMTYNGDGQIKSVTTALQHTTTYTYEGGDVVKVTDPLGAEMARFVDAVGQVLSTTDPLGRVSRYEYDAGGRLTRTTDPLAGVTTVSYYSDGQVQAVTDARNHTTTLTYDVMARLATRTDPLLRQEHFDYNEAGHLSNHIDRKGQATNRQYDALGRVHQLTYADGSTITYTYDVVGRVTGIADSVNGTITRQYDLLDRLESETTPEGTVTYTYDEAGRRTSMTVAGQSSVTYEYDASDRATLISQNGLNVQIDYDEVNRRTALTLPNGVVTEYSYDSASQVTGLTYRIGQVPIGSLTYTYDDAGNRIQVGGSFARTSLPSTVVAAYDAADQLTEWSGTTFSHDAGGNVASDGLTSYGWNARNQLSQLTGAVAASFSYDAVGRRSSKTLNGPTQAFLYDHDDAVQELTGGSSTSVRLGSGILDEWFVRSELSGITAPLVDALGSTIALVDDTGSITTQYVYDPFGKTTPIGPSSTSAFQYTGRENDNGDLYYYRARYYNPMLGRFLSEDMVSMPRSAYNYAANAPTVFADPSGLLEVRTGSVKESIVPQQAIPGTAVAHSSIGAGFTCYCSCEADGYRLHGILIVAGTIRLPSRVTRVPTVDKSVKDTNSARVHEWTWHINLAINVVRQLVEPLEAQPYLTGPECDDKCNALRKAAPNAFSKELRRTKAAEEAGKRPF